MMDLSKYPVDITGKNICVLGARRSGIAAAGLLAHKGAQVLLSDAGQVSFSDSQLQMFRDLNIRTETGKHSASVLESDLIVISPGIPSAVDIVKRIESRNIPIISEIEAAFWFMPPSAKLIAITGSNGKTTTTSLVYEIFKAGGFNAYCGGNIGTPFATLITQADNISDKYPVFILEVSSFQLERIIHFRPDIAIILNVTDDHMDRYDHDINLYLAAKLNISKNQTSEDIFIYFSDDKYLIHHLPEKPQKRPFGIRKKDNMLFRTDLESIYTQKGKEYVSRKNIRLLGEHNLLNIMAALNVAEHFKISKNTVLKVLKNFAGIEHRLEFVATIKGVDYYNDSKATNVESVKYALKSFTRPVIIIMGGRDKDSDFSTLLPYLSENVKEAVLIGEAAQKIENVIRGKIKYFHADSLSNAVDYAKTIAVAGDVILLAPACASFDMFDNYEHRGRVFKEIVQSIADKTDEN